MQGVEGLKENYIKRIGRIYFYVGDKDSEFETRVSIETLQNRDDYSSGYNLYFSEQDYSDKLAKTDLLSFFKKFFDYGGRSTDLSLDQLTKINKIIKGEC